MKRRVVPIVVFAVMLARPAIAQQRPLVTEDPEPIGAGRVLLETGVDFAADQQYPVSGLEGDLWRVPTIGISVGISSIAEFQIDGGPFNHLSIQHRNPAPLSHLLTVTGNSTSDVEDIVIGTKIRLLAEAPKHPSFAFRFATKLPNAGNEKRAGPRHHGLLRIAAGRQNRAVDSDRRQRRLRHPWRSDRWRSPERRADLRTVVRACADRSCRSGRGAERPRLDTKWHGVPGNRNPRDPEPRRALHSRVDSSGRWTVLRPHGNRSDDGLHDGVDVSSSMRSRSRRSDSQAISYQLSAFRLTVERSGEG